MITHRIVHDGGNQTVITIPYDEFGEPVVATSATYTIVDLRVGEDGTDREVQASTAATVDSVSTTTTAAAGTGTADKFKISLTSASGVSEGSSYVIDTGSGLRELVVVDYIATNDVYARDRLRHAYASGATFKGVEVSGTFPTAEAADDDSLDDGGGPYGIDWVFVGVSPTDVRDLAWIDRGEDKRYATVHDIRTLDQTLGSVSRSILKLEVCLTQAHRDFRAALRELGVDVDQYHGGENARDAVTYRAAAIARSHLSGERDIELAAEYNARYRGMLANLTAHGTVIVDTSEDDAPGGTTSHEITHFELT